MKEITLTEENFETEVLKSDKPVLVDFWATWCGPCMMMGPILAEIAEETDEVKIGKVNVDEQAGIAKAFGICSIPTLILFKNGKAEKQSVGLIPKEEILSFINQ